MSSTASKYSIQQNIPVSNHVYKFLISRCGGDVFQADRKTGIGSLILSLHTKNIDIRESVSKTKFSKTFSVVITEHQYLKTGMFLNLKSGQLFNSIIDKLFREEIYSHLIIQKKYQGNLFEQSLRNFLDVYKITEDDIKLETLLRDFQRKKAVIEKKLS